MIIAQITDLHIRSDNLPLWGEVDTVQALKNTVEHLNHLKPAPDIVLATGDLVDQPSAKAYKILKKHLKHLNIPVFLIPGNHDGRAMMLDAFGKKSAPYLPRKLGHLSYAIEDRPLRLIGLDSTEPTETGGHICRERAAWLDQTLAQKPDVPTLIFLHHPPFRVGIPHMDDKGFIGADRLARVLSRHRQVIHLICGHMHRPIQASWQGIPATIAPSAAFQLQFKSSGKKRVSVSKEPAMVALYHWDPDSGLMAHLSPILS